MRTRPRQAWPLFFIFTSTLIANASSKEIYNGVAKDKEGNVLYRERHEAVFGEGRRIIRAQTDYLKPNGEKFAQISSDFEADRTTPQYSFTDLRSGTSHGIEIQHGSYVVWRKDKSSKREEVAFPKSDFSEDALVVGCQGLHYYLVENLESLRNRKSLPIKYMIPGKLDYYSFTLNYDAEDENQVSLSLTINNRFFRLFTSRLQLKYRKNDRRLLSYAGLSNIPDDNGKNQFINLEYKYE